jgi:hypothetical protein
MYGQHDLGSLIRQRNDEAHTRRVAKEVRTVLAHAGCGASGWLGGARWSRYCAVRGSQGSCSCRSNDDQLADREIAIRPIEE